MLKMWYLYKYNHFVERRYNSFYYFFSTEFDTNRLRSIIWTNLNPLYQGMLCAKFGWNWPSGSGEENVFSLSMHFRNFVIISSWKRAGTYIWSNLNPLHPKMHCVKFGWNWPGGSGQEDFFEFHQCIFVIS